MSKPNRIILLRHATPEGNVNKEIYKTKPDYALNLTENGILQSIHSGKDLGILLRNEGVSIYVSPFYRTRQTFQYVKPFINVAETREDPRLREQEWCGRLRTEGYDYNTEERDAFGHFYYRFHGGESCADVFDRVSTFLETLHRDFRKPNYSKNCLIVTHGMTLRVFLMRWFRLTIEEFELLRNPKNAQFFVMELQKNGKYELITPLEKYEKRNCKY